MTFGSLFSGIGGLDLGFERAGMKCLWQVESDAYAQTILRKHWPEVPKYNDVRLVGAACLASPDIIAGGFPCQDISQAGRGEGIGGRRSGLWFEFARLVRELRPRFVLVENVPALRRKGLDVVLGDLASSGFDADWDCIPALAVGAPHRRDRVFVIASRQVRFASELPACDCCSEPFCDECQQHFFECSHRGPSSWAEALAHPDGSGREGRDDEVWSFGGNAGELLSRARRESLAGNWSAEPNVGRVAHGIPARLDRLRGLGNAVVPAVAEYLGRLILGRAKFVEQTK